MFALLKKLRGPSPVTCRKLDDKAWNQLHTHTKTSVQALGFRLPSNVDRNESHNAANERSKFALGGTPARPDATLSSASPGVGQKHRFARLAVMESSSGSSRSPLVTSNPSENPNGLLTVNAKLREGLEVAHSKATGSAQQEDNPPKEVLLNNICAAHNTGHRRAEAGVGDDVSEQIETVDPIQAGGSLLQYSKTRNFAAQVSPSLVGNTKLSFASQETIHPTATIPPPFTLKGILKYQGKVEALCRSLIGETQKSNILAHRVSLGGDSTEDAETQNVSVANLEKEKVPRMSANLEDVMFDWVENDENIRKKCDDRYKNMDSGDISLEFEHRRNGHRYKREKKARKRGARSQFPRGQQPYCTHRAVTSRPREYSSTVRSLPCKCGVPHAILKAKEWRSSPAEDEWDCSLQKGGNPILDTRRVTFVEPVVTEVRAFEEWWEDEYGLSDRYHSRGPFLHKSKDISTKADDDQEIRSMGHLSKQLSRNLHLAASNAIANHSNLTNSPAKTILDRLLAMDVKSHRAQKVRSKLEKRQREKAMIRRTRRNAIGPSRKAKVRSTTHLKFTANLLPSSNLKVAKSAPEHQNTIDRDQRSGEVTDAHGQCESGLVGGTPDIPASTDSQSETSSAVTSAPSQQYVDGTEDDFSSRTGLRLLRPFRDQGDSRKLRSPGPQYGGRTRWLPYHLTGPHKRHSPQRKESGVQHLMEDAIVYAALQQELALQADEANEVPTIEELPINEAIANAALEQELSLQADVAREVPTMEKLSSHNAAGEAKIKEWWDLLYKSHASRAASAFSYEAQTRDEDTDTAYHEQFDTLMSDPEEDFALSDPDEDAEMSDPDEDSEMLEVQDDVTPSPLTIPSHVQRGLLISSFNVGPGHIR